jgi:L-serine dehydratase
MAAYLAWLLKKAEWGCSFLCGCVILCKDEVCMSISVFDIIGPRMIGPSSSHTAGAVRIGQVANRLAGGKVKAASVTLYGSFAQTGRGHGTDTAIVAGILGLDPDEEGICYSKLLMKEAGLHIPVRFSHEEPVHPNTAQVYVMGEDGKEYTYVGTSIGGGRIEVTSINNMEVGFNCELPTLLVFHEDMPGVIMRVSSILALERINIAFMKVFRSEKSKGACMVIETDSRVDEATRRRIELNVDGITEVCTL